MNRFVGVIGVLAALAIWAPDTRLSPLNAQTGRQQPVRNVLHVDQRHPGATDRNPGTPERPIATVAEAARRALSDRDAGRATTILIHPGTYREGIELNASRADPSAPAIVLEATEPGRVTISGSDVWTDWQTSVDPDVFWHSQRIQSGLDPMPGGWDEVANDVAAHPVLLRHELVFVADRLMKQVMSLDRVRTEASTFFVQEGTPRLPGRIWLHAPAGIDPRRAQVEVAVRPTAIVANRIGNLTLRGLVLQHAATPLQGAALQLNGSSRVLVEATRVIWNNWNGVALNDVSDVTLRQVDASHNGAGGVGSFRARLIRLEDVDASFNNWRGGWAQFTGWATGQKFFHVHDADFVRYRAVENQATGLWFDTDAARVRIEDATLSRNLTRGLFIEAVQGPFSVSHSQICDNGDVGIFSTSAANVTLESNTITGNGEHQVFIPWMAEHHVLRNETDYENGQPLRISTTQWTVSGNLIGGSGNSLLFSVGEWDGFFKTLRSDRNRWFHTSNRRAFGIYPRMHADAIRLDLAGWQQFAKQDGASTFSSSASGAGDKVPPPR